MTLLDPFSQVALVACSIIYLVVHYLSKKYSYWKTLGVPQLGFSEDVVFQFRRNRSNIIKGFYERLANNPYGGFYQGSKPYLMIRDPDLIRKFLIKDFSHFPDRGLIVYEDIDPLQVHIFNLSGQRWKNIRNKLTPTFSSGKLRSMYSLLEECTEVLDKYLERVLKSSTEHEVRNIMTKFTIDVIGICAFGLNLYAIDDDNSEFNRIRRLMFTSPLKFYLRQILRAINPEILHWLKLKSLKVEVEEFFFSLTRQSLQQREENQQKRNDFMQLLINVQREEQKSLQTNNDNSEPLFTENIIAANVFVFFIAGFETTALTLSYCLYELALNPEVMEKLHEEIITTSKAHGGKLDSDVLKGMRYMDCVVSETLRKYPPVGWLDRVCVKSYQIPNSALLIKEKSHIIIPVYGLHYDPQYFPNPEKFDPERFNEENKQRIVPGTYLPFGDGPRICIGMRFAQMEMKSCLCKIISKYTVHPTVKTQIPLTFNPSSVVHSPKKGIYVRFQKRNQ